MRLERQETALGVIRQVAKAFPEPGTFNFLFIIVSIYVLKIMCDFCSKFTWYGGNK